MKATELLQKQHRDIEALLERLRGAGQGEERAIRDELAAQLVAHTIIEQEHFYPAVREAMPEEILEAIEEHGLADFELARLLQTRAGHETSEAKGAVLAEVVMRHLRKEETDVFPAANRELGDEQLNQLGDRMAARFRQVVDGGYKKVLNKALIEMMPRTTGRPATAAKAPAKRGAKRAAAGQAARAGSRAKASTQKPATQKRATQKRSAETARGGARKGQKAATGRAARAGSRGRTSRASRSRA